MKANDWNKVRRNNKIMINYFHALSILFWNYTKTIIIPPSETILL